MLIISVSLWCLFIAFSFFFPFSSRMQFNLAKRQATTVQETAAEFCISMQNVHETTNLLHFWACQFGPVK